MATSAPAMEASISHPPPGAGFARFLRLRGFRVLEYSGILWHNVAGGLYMSLPYYLSIDLPPAELDAMLRSFRAVGVRYPSRHQTGSPSGLYVCDPQSFTLGSLDSRIRRSIKHGLAECDIRRLSPDELIDAGLTINIETMSRQSRFDPEFGQPRRWRRFVEAAFSCDCILPVGAFTQDGLAAYAITCIEDNWLSVLYRMSTHRIPGGNVCRALDFTILSKIASECGATCCSMGLMPLVPNEGLHLYKQRLGIRCEPQNSVIRFHPALEPVLTSRAVLAAAGLTARLIPRHSIQQAEQVVKAAAVSLQISRGVPMAESDAPADVRCQQEAARTFSRLRRPYLLVLSSRFLAVWKETGLPAALNRAISTVTRRWRRPPVVPPPILPPHSKLNLSAGDWVEVKPEPEILATLDSAGRCKGLAFLPEMRASCGKRMRVFRRVEKIYLEESRQQRKLADTVLLEGSYCTGAGIGCDRSCLFFWREAWLKRVENGAPANLLNG